MATTLSRAPETADIPPSSRCASCGKCCLALPGQFLPGDLGGDESARQAKARDLLKTGLYSIDWYEGDVDPDGDMPHIYHLRPATRHGRDKIFDPSWGGACVMLGASGCTLERADRPTVCKALVPSENCNGLTKRDVAVAWRTDSDWLGRLGEQISQEEI